jgi:hypothetical protein
VLEGPPVKLSYGLARTNAGPTSLPTAPQHKPVSSIRVRQANGNSVGTFLRLFPTSILGVILFLTGAQLALGACDISKDKGERFVTVVTGALAVWNVGIAFLVGMAAYALNKRGLLRL